MGYEVHITRRDFWADETGPVIAKAEWLKYVASDYELRLNPPNGPCFAVWKNNSDEEWLNWSDGVISAKQPSRGFLRKMFSIAMQLQANLQGDDGELYDAEGCAELNDGQRRNTRPIWLQYLAWAMPYLLIPFLISSIVLAIILIFS